MVKKSFQNVLSFLFPATGRPLPRSRLPLSSSSSFFFLLLSSSFLFLLLLLLLFFFFFFFFLVEFPKSNLTGGANYPDVWIVLLRESVSIKESPLLQILSKELLSEELSKLSEEVFHSVIIIISWWKVSNELFELLSFLNFQIELSN